jgi:hypothetical protein
LSQRAGGIADIAVAGRVASLLIPMRQRDRLRLALGHQGSNLIPARGSDRPAMHLAMRAMFAHCAGGIPHTKVGVRPPLQLIPAHERERAPIGRRDGADRAHSRARAGESRQVPVPVAFHHSFPRTSGRERVRLPQTLTQFLIPAHERERDDACSAHWVGRPRSHARAGRNGAFRPLTLPLPSFPRAGGEEVVGPPDPWQERLVPTRGRGGSSGNGQRCETNARSHMRAGRNFSCRISSAGRLLFPTSGRESPGARECAGAHAALSHAWAGEP